MGISIIWPYIEYEMAIRKNGDEMTIKIKKNYINQGKHK